MKLIILFFLFFINFSYSNEQKKVYAKYNYSQVIIRPGARLGDVLIGQSKSTLIQKGYTSDKDRDPNQYFRKNSILVRFEKDQVSQMWYEGNINNLRLRGNKFPSTTDSITLTKFFKGCEPKIKGTGGILYYCENRGIELSYSFNDKLQSISVVTPSLVKKIISNEY